MTELPREITDPVIFSASMVRAEKQAIMDLALNLSERLPDHKVHMPTLGRYWNNYRATVETKRIHPVYAAEHTVGFLTFLRDKKPVTDDFDSQEFQAAMASYVMDKIVHDAIHLGHIISERLIVHATAENVVRKIRSIAHEAVGQAAKNIVAKHLDGEAFSSVVTAMQTAMEAAIRNQANEIRSLGA